MSPCLAEIYGAGNNAAMTRPKTLRLTTALLEMIRALSEADGIERFPWLAKPEEALLVDVVEAITSLAEKAAGRNLSNDQPAEILAGIGGTSAGRRPFSSDLDANTTVLQHPAAYEGGMPTDPLERGMVEISEVVGVVALDLVTSGVRADTVIRNLEHWTSEIRRVSESTSDPEPDDSEPDDG